MEHSHDHRVEPEMMHPGYREREARFRDEAGKLWDEEARTRSQIRADVSLTDEERMDRYIAGYQRLEERLEKLSEAFGREMSKSVSEATSKLYSGSGEKFSEHLTSLANVPDERLSELMATARRSGQEDLGRAIAITAYQRGGSAREVFSEWAVRDPARAEAIKRIQGTPGAEQLYTRTTRTMRPPKASVEDLMPALEDRRKAAEAEAAKNRPRVEFFGQQGIPTQQVGRRVS